MKYLIYNPRNILIGEDQSLMSIRKKNIVAHWAESNLNPLELSC